MSTTSSKNFTTLYSGSGSVTPQAPYGNANVVGLLAAGTDGANTVGNITATGAVNTTGTISATGNITTAGYFVGNFAGNITGNLTVPGSNTQVLFNNQGNAGAAAGLTFDSAANVLVTSGNITAVGNVQGNYFLGNGSQLTGLPATYGNANVTTLLAAFGSNTISSTGNITTTANIAGGYILGNGSQLTGLPANYGNANVTSLLANFGSNTISSTGNITTTANISGGFILGNGSQLTGLPANYGNANVTTLLAAFGSNAISTTGNVTAGNFIGNGQYLTNINAGNITGAYGNANVAAFMAAFGANTITTTGNVTAGNISATGTVSISGLGINFAGSGLVNATNHLAYAGQGAAFGSYNTGNTTGNAYMFTDGAAGNVQLIAGPSPSSQTWNFSGATGNLTLPGNTSAINYANGVSILTGLGSTYGNANVAANLAAFGSNPILTTGNISGGNLVASANLTSTQQTVVGTANVGTTGNIVVSGRNLATDMAFVPDGATGTNQYIGRVMLGTGWAGNIAVGNPSRLATMDMINRGNTATAVRQFDSDSIVNLTANVTNTTFRQQALGARVRVGGGASANTTALGAAFGAPFSMAAGQFNVDVGNVTPYFLGNTTLSHAALNSGALTLNGGSSIGNAYGYVPGITTGGSGASNITTYIGMASSFNAGNITGNLFCFYNGNTTSLASYGVLTANSARAATNYYFLRNDDDVAQAKLGSLRTYHEFEAQTATSGSFAIDKNTAQVHNIAPTGNCTITGYSNMVTSASDGTNTDSQVDTLTIIIEQGTTPYTVTLPTGAAYKYAGNVSTVGATANAVTMISVTAANVRGTTTYLTTVSPEFV
jgi:hypothetical protein